jgi:hypothetical protein
MRYAETRDKDRKKKENGSSPKTDIKDKNNRESVILSRVESKKAPDLETFPAILATYPSNASKGALKMSHIKAIKGFFKRIQITPEEVMRKENRVIKFGWMPIFARNSARGFRMILCLS